MNKKFLLIMGMVTTVVIVLAGINVKLNENLTNLVGLSLNNIEARSDGECGGCSYTLMSKNCRKSGDISDNDSGDTNYDLCPEAGDMCPGTTKHGCLKKNAPSYVCYYRVYN